MRAAFLDYDTVSNGDLDTTTLTEALLIIVTPHVAWAAREARQRCLDEMAANVSEFLVGGRRGRVV